jgi:hypothetical protein
MFIDLLIIINWKKSTKLLKKEIKRVKLKKDKLKFSAFPFGVPRTGPAYRQAGSNLHILANAAT